MNDDDRHIMKCTDDECIVCDSYLEELRETWGYVWFQIQQIDSGPTQEELTKYS